MVIFVTGKSGSGKSTFARELADKLNYEYVDVDKIGHSIYEGNVLAEVVKLFGDDILDNGIINRKKLGKKLFTEKDQSKIDKFNDITGEAIRHKVEPYLLKDVVVEWILLPLTKFWNTPAYRVLVKGVSDEVRLAKIMARDGVDIEYLRNRENASVEYNECEFDQVVINDYEENSLENAVLDIVAQLNNIG